MTMIEKVARAFARHDSYESAWKRYRGHAKAAIAAMREPTEEMLNASPDYPIYMNADEWAKMIDAALKE